MESRLAGDQEDDLCPHRPHGGHGRLSAPQERGRHAGRVGGKCGQTDGDDQPDHASHQQGGNGPRTGARRGDCGQGLTLIFPFTHRPRLLHGFLFAVMASNRHRRMRLF